MPRVMLSQLPNLLCGIGGHFQEIRQRTSSAVPRHYQWLQIWGGGDVDESYICSEAPKLLLLPYPSHQNVWSFEKWHQPQLCRQRSKSADSSGQDPHSCQRSRQWPSEGDIEPGKTLNHRVCPCSDWLNNLPGWEIRRARMYTFRHGLLRTARGGREEMDNTPTCHGWVESKSQKDGLVESFPTQEPFQARSRLLKSWVWLDGRIHGQE